MREVSTIKEIRSVISQWKKEGLSIGFVPTMGYLHKGHFSLVQSAASETDRVVVSIFVNPMQFDKAEDLNKYPVSIEKDKKNIALYGGDMVFIPDTGEIYPHGFDTSVEVSGLDNELCGATRPGHFKGVCTIITKLFNLVQPDKAYFGEKDYQQLRIISKMTQELHIPVEVVGCPIVRDENGLALSSRNARLSADKRKKALIIRDTLKEIKKRVKSGETRVDILKDDAVKKINEISDLKVDYLEIVDNTTLQKIDQVDGNAVAAAGVFVGRVRLIDNIKLS